MSDIEELREEAEFVLQRIAQAKLLVDTAMDMVTLAYDEDEMPAPMRDAMEVMDEAVELLEEHVGRVREKVRELITTQTSDPLGWPRL